MSIDDALNELEGAERNTQFSRLKTICSAIFGDSRQSGSHLIFKTGMRDPPLVNLQLDKGGKAKPYQVKQVIEALRAKKGSP